MKKISFSPEGKKTISSLLLAGAALMAYFAVLDAILERTAVHRLDERGRTYYTESLKRSAYTYAVARGINGVISVLQGTDVAVSPAGIGVTLAVGEILDPVNDLVERFSWVMLVSAASLGIQMALMEMGAWFGFRVLLTAALILIVMGIWIPRTSWADFRRVGSRLILVAVIIRFGLPAVALVSGGIYDHFLADRYETSIRSLERINDEIREAGAEAETSGGYFDGLRRFFAGGDDESDPPIRERIAGLKEQLSDYAEYVITLITVFVLQTVILPLGILWALIRLGGYLMARPLLPPGRLGRRS